MRLSCSGVLDNSVDFTEVVCNDIKENIATAM